MTRRLAVLLAVTALVLGAGAVYLTLRDGVAAVADPAGRAVPGPRGRATWSSWTSSSRATPP